jgi:DNA-binding NtrC family response regulator
MFDTRIRRRRDGRPDNVAREYERPMDETTERPVLGIVDTSADIRDLLTMVFEEEGFCVVSAFVPEIKQEWPAIENFLRRHRPVAVIWDISIPYETNWRFFRCVEGSDAGRSTRYVLTCANKRALDELGGPTPTPEIIGKPYDLDRLIDAVRRAIDQGQP